MSRRINVKFVIDADAGYVSGYGSRDLILRAGGRRPIWSHRRRAWGTSRRVARDLVALAESDGAVVTCSDVERGGRA